MTPPSSTDRSPLDAATVLENAADLLLIRGRTKNTYGWMHGGPRCVVGAIAECSGLLFIDANYAPATLALRCHVARNVTLWSDTTEDDFEIIDTLRLVAKGLRNAATP